MATQASIPVRRIPWTEGLQSMRTERRETLIKHKENSKWLYCCLLLSHVQLFATLWTEVCQASLSFTVSQSLLKFMSIESVMPSSHLILWLLFLPSVFPSIKVFCNELALHIRWPKYWSFNFSTSLSTEYSVLISFMIDWFDFLVVQGTLRSLLQHRNSKSSILRHSDFFMVKLSHSYLTTGKTVTLSIQIFVVKLMSLLFNMLSSILVIISSWAVWKE